jgi:hypothetical protein
MGNNGNHYDLIPFISGSTTGIVLGLLFILTTTHIKFLSKKHLDEIENKSKNRIVTML